MVFNGIITTPSQTSQQCVQHNPTVDRDEADDVFDDDHSVVPARRLRGDADGRGMYLGGQQSDQRPCAIGDGQSGSPPADVSGASASVTVQAPDWSSRRRVSPSCMSSSSNSSRRRGGLKPCELEAKCEFV